MTQVTFSTFVSPKCQHTILIAGSTCPTCGQQTVCSACGRCHYCEDVDLPCRGNNVTSPRNEMTAQAGGAGRSTFPPITVALIPEPEEQPHNSLHRQIDKALMKLSSGQPIVSSQDIDATLLQMAEHRRQWLAIQYPQGLPTELAALFFQQGEEVSE